MELTTYDELPSNVIALFARISDGDALRTAIGLDSATVTSIAVEASLSFPASSLDVAVILNVVADPIADAFV